MDGSIDSFDRSTEAERNNRVVAFAFSRRTQVPVPERPFSCHDTAYRSRCGFRTPFWDAQRKTNAINECNQRINQPTNVVEQGTGAKMNPCSGRVSSRRSDRNESIIQPPRNEIESNRIESNHPSMPHHTPLNILSCFRRESLAPRHPGTITTRGLFRSFPGFLRFSVRDPWNFL